MRAMALAESEIKRLSMIHRLSRDKRSVVICCWLSLPGDSEIERMDEETREQTTQLVKIKKRAIKGTATLIMRKFSMNTQAAHEIAEAYAGNNDLHRSFAKKWGMSERSFYRKTAIIGRCIGKILFEYAVLLSEHGIEAMEEL